ncbi:MAG: hypothetical protein GY821_15385 [Gammaproteobacteria bacterium]|nr:hypothetical protein [Gammaproteobacteria bacterium]
MFEKVIRENKDKGYKTIAKEIYEATGRQITELNEGKNSNSASFNQLQAVVWALLELFKNKANLPEDEIVNIVAELCNQEAAVNSNVEDLKTGIERFTSNNMKKSIFMAISHSYINHSLAVSLFNGLPFYDISDAAQNADLAVKDMLALLNDKAISKKEAGVILFKLCNGEAVKKGRILKSLLKHLNGNENQQQYKEICEEFLSAAGGVHKTLFDVNNQIKTDQDISRSNDQLSALENAQIKVEPMIGYISDQGPKQMEVAVKFVIDRLRTETFSSMITDKTCTKEFFEGRDSVKFTQAFYSLYNNVKTEKDLETAIKDILSLTKSGVLSPKKAQYIISAFCFVDADKSTKKIHLDVRNRITSVMKEIIMQSDDHSVESANIAAVLIPIYGQLTYDNYGKSEVIASSFKNSHGEITDQSQFNSTTDAAYDLVSKMHLMEGGSIGSFDSIESLKVKAVDAIKGIVDNEIKKKAFLLQKVKNINVETKEINGHPDIRDMYVRALMGIHFGDKAIKSKDDFKLNIMQSAECLLHKEKALTEEDVAEEIIRRCQDPNQVGIIHALLYLCENSDDNGSNEKIIKSIINSPKFIKITSDLIKKGNTKILDLFLNKKAMDIAKSNPAVSRFLISIFTDHYQLDFG